MAAKRAYSDCPCVKCGNYSVVDTDTRSHCYDCKATIVMHYRATKGTPDADIGCLPDGTFVFAIVCDDLVGYARIRCAHTMQMTHETRSGGPFRCHKCAVTWPDKSARIYCAECNTAYCKDCVALSKSYLASPADDDAA